jgi:mannose-6-phosphate isomerase-like protein (cupin superfamily)
MLLIDDHEVTRAACRALLRTEGVDVVADVAADDHAIAAVGALEPDVVIVDLTPADDRAARLAKRIRELDCDPSVVLTSSVPRPRVQPHLDGFAFVAKADLCSVEVLKAIRDQHSNRKGEALNPSTTPTKRAVQPLWFLHNLAIIHTASDQTEGSFSVVELTGAPGDIPPLHVHHRDDEGFWVLEGAIRLHIGGEQVVHLGAGHFALAPRGVPHVYVVESGQPARWLTISNGGFDRFVAEVSVPASEPTLPTQPDLPPPDELIAIAARHGIEILGPPGTMPEQP